MPTDLVKYNRNYLRNPEFKRLLLEIAGQILQLRKHKKMSQQTLAKKIGTTQSNIARMEAGNQNFSLATLGKLAAVFGKRLEVSFK